MLYVPLEAYLHNNSGNVVFACHFILLSHSPPPLHLSLSPFISSALHSSQFRLHFSPPIIVLLHHLIAYILLPNSPPSTFSPPISDSPFIISSFLLTELYRTCFLIHWLHFIPMQANASVQVDAADPFGILITNGEFTAFVDPQFGTQVCICIQWNLINNNLFNYACPLNIIITIQFASTSSYSNIKSTV